jgi:hypothetical protein
MPSFRSFSAESYRLFLKASTPRLLSSIALMRSWLQTNCSQAGSVKAMAITTACGANKRRAMLGSLVMFYSPPPAGVRTNGYETMTIPPPRGFGNSQRRRLNGAVLDAGVAHGRVLEHRGDDLTRRRDGELHHDAAAQVGLLRELLLVAVLHLVDVAPDDAADDLLVERPADVGLTGDDVGRVGTTAAQAAGAAAVARAVAAAAALANRAQVAKADRALARAAAARARADEPEAADAVGLADLVADEAAQHVLGVGAEGRVTTEDRGDVRALVHLEDAEDTGVLGLLLRELLREVRIRVVLRTLEAVETLLVLGGLLAHLAFFALVALALAALLLVLLRLEPLGDLLLLLLRRLDEELHEPVVGVEEVERERLRIRRDREDHEEEQRERDDEPDE